MGLIEDLMSNKYLITPSAYYLLEGYYRRDFTLAELVKFARIRGTFVVDSTIARGFLEEKGLLPKATPLENFISGARNRGAEGEFRGPTSEESPLKSTSSSQKHEESPEPVDTSSRRIALSEDSGTYISTGTTGQLEEGPAPVGQSGAETGELDGGRSYISTGTPGGESAKGASEPFSGQVRSQSLPETAPALPLEGESPENGYSNGTSNENEDMSGHESGDEEESLSRVVYGDYGVPITYEEELPKGEKKAYTVYGDLSLSPREGFHYRAPEIPDDWQVVFDVKNFKLSPPKARNANGKDGEIIVKAYAKLFRSRLRKMKRILRENPEVGGVIDIGKLSYLRTDEEVTIIGLVNSKRETQKGYMFELEDGTGGIKVFINRRNEDAKKFFQIMPDSVVAFKGRPSGRNIFFANRIYLPDVPKFRKSKPPLKEKVYAVLLSDLHVGSNKFCEKAFMRFLEWLNGEVNNRTEEELVSRVKYLVLAGDVVDGVGIYPGQYEELAIPDIFDQYEALANLLKNVPEHIHMFIGPGNHDAARTALPQPGFYEEYARPIFKLKNTTIISNPAVLRLHGRDFLIYHGRGIEDVVNIIPKRSHHRPAEATVNLLKLRHLAPTFGEKVPIAPDPEDLLVIENVPDLFQTGHVHVMEYQTYNGVFVINAGTWQAQTEFQKMVNIVPTPAMVPIIDVETAKLRAVVHFDQFCEGV